MFAILLLTQPPRLLTMRNLGGYLFSGVGKMTKPSYKEAALGKYIELISGQHILAHHVNTVAKGIPYLTGPADFPAGYIQQSKFVEKPKTMCKKGDLLLTVKGSGVGSMVVADNSYCISRQLMALRAQRIDADFLSYVVPNAMQDLIRRAAIGMIPGISRADILNLKILVPAMPEQQKIAAILKTWDEAIYLTEQLIEKKQKYKKALMWLLLFAKLRFSQFKNEKWHKTNLAKICLIKKGEQLNKSVLTEFGEFPALNGGVWPSGYTNKWNTDVGIITISEGGNSCGYVNISRSKFWCGGHCYALLNVTTNTNFLYYKLKIVEPEIMRLRVGSGLPNIQRKDLESFTLKMPNSLQEQQKIANIFAHLDQEIQILEKQLLAIKNQKHALMQQLLTGKLRI